LTKIGWYGDNFILSDNFAIRREGYSNLQRDISLLDKSTEFARRSAELGIMAGDASTSAQKRARTTGFLSRGLLTGMTMFA
jgi:hypothetical protein